MVRSSKRNEYSQIVKETQVISFHSVENVLSIVRTDEHITRIPKG